MPATPPDVRPPAEGVAADCRVFFRLAIGGAALSAESDPASVVLGVAFAIKDEVEGASGFAAEMKQKNLEIDAAIDQCRGLLEDLGAEEKEMALLLTVSGHADGFTSNVQAAEKAIDGLLDQVRRLGAGIDELGLLDGRVRPVGLLRWSADRGGRLVELGGSGVHQPAEARARTVGRQGCPSDG